MSPLLLASLFLLAASCFHSSPSEADLPQANPSASALSNITEYDWGELPNYVVIPSYFDSREQWPGLIADPSLFESECDGSWARAAADVLSDRFSITFSTPVTLSSQLILNCQSSGCDGGTPKDAWNFLNNCGTVEDVNLPFIGTSDECIFLSEWGMFNAKNLHTFTTTSSMKLAILQEGPIQVCFPMYADFMDNYGGVYVHTYGEFKRNECVKVIGWGIDGAPYWLAIAYLGTEVGAGGVFKIQMNQLGANPVGYAGGPFSPS